VACIYCVHQSTSCTFGDPRTHPSHRTITAKQVRRLLEGDLNLPTKALDEHKKTIDVLLSKVPIGLFLSCPAHPASRISRVPQELLPAAAALAAPAPAAQSPTPQLPGVHDESGAASGDGGDESGSDDSEPKHRKGKTQEERTAAPEPKKRKKPTGEARTAAASG
jgi:hypothetical protein